MRRLMLVAIGAVVAALLMALPVLAGSISRSDVRMLSDSSVVGTSQLVRTENGISFSLRTSGLVPGSANSIWVVIFNNPGACSGGCDAGDLGTEAVGGRAVWGAGNVAGANGTAGFGGHIPAGPYDPDLLAKGGGGAGTGLNPDTAEVHLVVRTHGDAWPGNIADQIHSFGLGCNPECANRQASIHTAP